MSENSDLHGNAPDTNEAALLLVDVINDFEFPGGDKLLENALPVAARIAALKGRARAEDIPVVYVNDNFGRWRSSFHDVLVHSLEPGVRGRPFVEQLKPDADDYFVLKPKNSAFYQTPLDILLKHLGTRRLIVAGLCTNSCVLFSANDAYLRDLELFIPEDCSAAFSSEEHRSAMAHMQSTLKADTTPSPRLDLKRLASK